MLPTVRTYNIVCNQLENWEIQSFNFCLSHIYPVLLHGKIVINLATLKPKLTTLPNVLFPGTVTEIDSLQEHGFLTVG